MLRRTLTILSLIGMLLSVGLWGVSYFDISYTSWGLLFWIAFVAALICHSGIHNYLVACMVAACAATIAVHLFAYVREGPGDAGWLIISVLFAALYSVAIAAGVGFPFLVWRVWKADRRRKRKKLGLCLKCGYDLRASEDRCPECGQKMDETTLC